MSATPTRDEHPRCTQAVLALVVDQTSPGPGDIEQQLSKAALSVVQIGELLVAAAYALIAREAIVAPGRCNDPVSLPSG